MSNKSSGKYRTGKPYIDREYKKVGGRKEDDYYQVKKTEEERKKEDKEVSRKDTARYNYEKAKKDLSRQDEDIIYRLCNEFKCSVKSLSF